MEILEVLTATISYLALVGASPIVGSSQGFEPPSGVVARSSSPIPTNTTVAVTPNKFAACPGTGSSIPTPVDRPGVIFRWQYLNFDAFQVCGFAWITIHEDGYYNFGGQFTNSGPESYHLALASGFKDARQVGYSFEHTCQVVGSSPCEWEDEAYDRRIRERWGDIWAFKPFAWRALLDRDEIDPELVYQQWIDDLMPGIVIPVVK
ncbi:uncharacterized protein LTR77_010959 [Saxophila tyrrhenica]|uniref:Uncharacterized protein n=1 Tax=Saxophila tyrrhenica TaxID=1690608 RepID=A0AAV9NU24_9PEZI|nr:hypothetical protein LTR77_010959 [Saxophila tyrrhenica]